MQVLRDVVTLLRLPREIRRGGIAMRLNQVAVEDGPLSISNCVAAFSAGLGDQVFDVINHEHVHRRTHRLRYAGDSAASRLRSTAATTRRCGRSGRRWRARRTRRTRTFGGAAQPGPVPRRAHLRYQRPVQVALFLGWKINCISFQAASRFAPSTCAGMDTIQPPVDEP